MDSESTQKLLRDYKFSNTPLEKVVEALFAMENINKSCLKEEQNKELITELAFKLVDYKFNKTNKQLALVVQDLEVWFRDNGYKLRPSNTYGGNNNNWG